MSQPDDIDKLLREVAEMTGQAPARRAEPADQPAAPAPPGRSARITWTGASALGGAAVGGVAGTALAFLPYVSTFSTAIGAALGAAAAGLVSGPPGWFRRRR